MKHQFHKKAKYTTLILVSLLPFSEEVLADIEKKLSAVKTLSISDINSTLIKCKALAENGRQVINETRDFVSGTQQALTALEKNDTKAAFEILQDVSKKLAIIQANYPAPTLFTAEMEVDILDIESNADTVQKELKQVDDLLDDETLQSAFLSVPFYKRLKMQQL